MSPDSTSDAVEPVYDEDYYRHYEGGAYDRSEQWLSFFGGVAEEIVDRLAPTTVLDAGCAIGLLVEALVERGVDASGIDVSEYAIAQVPAGLADRVRVGSLADPLEGRFDLIVCIEVLEHIGEPELRRALDNLCAATDRLLISSTPGHYDDPTHVNVKQPEQWSAELARRGFVRDLGFDASFLSPWAALYHRSTRSWPQVIEDYDRRWWYQQREIRETREGILRMQDQVRDLRVAVEEARAPGDSPELAEARQEILRLRDELTGALAAKGSASGQAARLRAELAQAAALADEAVEQRDAALDEARQVRASTTWRVGRAVTAPWRRLTGRP